MKVYRIAKLKYSNNLSGRGAEKYGGRWNEVGTPVLYTSRQASLSLLEVLVHLPKAYVPHDFQLVTIECPGKSIRRIRIDDLGKNWSSAANTLYIKNLGKQWIQENKSLCLEVPSAILPGKRNIIINPMHPLYNQVKILSIDPLPLDKRLII